MRSKLISAVAVACLLALSGWVAAQPAPGQPSAADKKQMEGLEKSAEKKTAEMGSALTRSFELLQEATAAGDVACINTRNSAITAMKSLVKLSDDNKITLSQKKAAGDLEGVENEYVKISIAHAKVGELFAQVRSACGIDVDVDVIGVDSVFEFANEMPVIDAIDLVGQDDPVDLLPDQPIHASPYY